MHDAEHPAKKPRGVELLGGTWKQYGRGIIEGVWGYAQKHGPWLIDVEPMEADESTAIPVVNVSGTQLKGVDFPRVTSDSAAVARLVVEHLRAKGYTNIAFCGVDIPVERIGYEAARTLDLLMQGRADKVQDVRIPPLGVVTRQSSDVFAVDDAKLRQALRFIRDHAHEGLDVRDLLRAVPVARRTMKRRSLRFTAIRCIGGKKYEETHRIQNEVFFQRGTGRCDGHTGLRFRCRNVQPAAFRPKGIGTFRSLLHDPEICRSLG